MTSRVTPFTGTWFSLEDEKAHNEPSPVQVAPSSPECPLPNETPPPAPDEPAHTSCTTRFIECISNGATSICNRLADLINRIRDCFCCCMMLEEAIESPQIEEPPFFTYGSDSPATRYSYTVTYRLNQ